MWLILVSIGLDNDLSPWCQAIIWNMSDFVIYATGYISMTFEKKKKKRQEVHFRMLFATCAPSLGRVPLTIIKANRCWDNSGLWNELSDQTLQKHATKTLPTLAHAQDENEVCAAHTAQILVQIASSGQEQWCLWRGIHRRLAAIY